jgi:hypothetical protein
MPLLGHEPRSPVGPEELANRASLVEMHQQAANVYADDVDGHDLCLDRHLGRLLHQAAGRSTDPPRR